MCPQNPLDPEFDFSMSSIFPFKSQLWSWSAGVLASPPHHTSMGTHTRIHYGCLCVSWGCGWGTEYSKIENEHSSALSCTSSLYPQGGNPNLPINLCWEGRELRRLYSFTARRWTATAQQQRGRVCMAQAPPYQRMWKLLWKIAHASNLVHEEFRRYSSLRFYRLWRCAADCQWPLGARRLLVPGRSPVTAALLSKILTQAAEG